MSDDQEESWRWHCLEVELRRLSSIRERARIELDPDRLARVEGILRGLASADPTRSNVLQQKEPVYSYDDDDDATRDPLLHYRPLHDRGEPWPVSPKVKFERDLLARGYRHLLELGERELGEELNDDVSIGVVAFMQWRKLPDNQRGRYASDFQRESQKCVKLLHTQYEALQDPVNIPYLLEIYLSSSSDPSEGGTAESELLASLRSERVIAYNRIQESSPTIDTFRLQCEVDDDHSLDIIRAKVVTAVLCGRLKAPSPAAAKRRFDEMVPEEYKSLHFYERKKSDIFTNEMKEELSELLAPWREWHLMREHAMLALIPLLPQFSSNEAEWLVYASCTSGLEYPLSITQLEPMTLSVMLLREFYLVDPADLMSSVGTHRLFACELPKAIVQAMCTFVLDERIAPSPSQDDKEGDRVKVAQTHLVRFATENPESAHIVHSTVAAVMEKTIRLAKPLATDAVKRERLAALGRRQVDLDFLNRGEIARMVEVVMDCNAQSCISAVHKIYNNCNPNHAVALYGRQGLIAVLFVMGMGNRVKAKHVDTASRMASFTLSGADLTGASRSGVCDDNFTHEVIRKQLKAMEMKHSGGSAVRTTHQTCACCGITAKAAGSSLLRCSRCQLIKYCGLECQKKDWKKHKRRCSPCPGS